MTSVTVHRLVEAVRHGDLEAVRSMLDARPELVDLDVAENDEHRAIHHAVLQRRPLLVRFLMQRGADARKGIWPHRSATTALTLAAERGDHEIVRIIEEEEAQRRRSGSAEPGQSQPDAGTAPADTPVPTNKDTTLSTRDVHAAIATGNVEWLKALHASRQVTNGRGLLSHAIGSNRSEMLKELLALGLDPDESGHVEGLDEIVPTWGEPLRTCARSGAIDMAHILLDHGANANTNVYAASSAMYDACKRNDAPMIALLEAHGGRLTPVAVAELGLVAQAARLLAGSAVVPMTRRLDGAGPDVAQDLLWGAIESPSPEIVALALAAVDWPRDDPRWHGILENGLYLPPDADRPRHLDAFRLVLDRCEPDVPSRRGTTILHEVAASRGGLAAGDRIAYGSLLLDRGACLDIRDDLLHSTPLGWACRWGRTEMAALLLDRGADPIEREAPAWATPLAWATKKGHDQVVSLLEEFSRQRS